VFVQLIGCTVSQYRNRLRVSLALDQIGQGAPDLASLAHDLGFSDHAHLTRTVQAATGQNPQCLPGIADRTPTGPPVTIVVGRRC
jgi:transcriptional regulator GlxA family with amidase domain